MSQEELGEAFVDIFEQGLYVGKDGAVYLEECTRLQALSQLWFEYWVGHITDSKFGTVRNAHTNSPPV